MAINGIGGPNGQLIGPLLNLRSQLDDLQTQLAAGKKAEGNYWGEGATTLEWTLSSPPPFHQFETLPVIEDAHH